MLIKNFQADSMHEAMKRVKQEFGNDAVILNSQVVEARGVPGSKPKRRFEITAGKDMPAGSRVQKPEQKSQPQTGSLSSSDRRILGDVGLIIKRFEKEINYLVHTQKEIRALLKTPREGQAIGSYLELHDLEKDIVSRIFEQGGIVMDDGSISLELLRARLLKLCENPQPIKLFASGVNKVMFVGPPGIGKSALISKVAANLVFRRNVKTTLVNLDDYQPFAGKSLETFGKLLKIPCKDESEWSQPHESEDFHVLLADTKGVPIGSDSDLDDLRQKIEIYRPDEIHLVIPAYALWREASRWMEFFKPIYPTQVAITFLDQTESFGMPFNIAAHNSMKLSYFSWGRSKVSNLEEADLFTLSSRLFEKVEEFDVNRV